MDFVTGLLPIIIALVGGAGFWAFLTNGRTATSAEYKQFVQDLQQERRDREAALDAVRSELDTERNARLKTDLLVAEQKLLIGDLVDHVNKLETIIADAGGVVPRKPHRLATYIRNQQQQTA